MKQFKKWLVEMDDQQQPPGGMPPVNGGIKPSVPPEVASELSAIAQKMNDLLKRLGIDGKNDDDDDDDGEPKPEKGLGDKGMGDKGTSPPPGPPPNFQ